MDCSDLVDACTRLGVTLPLTGRVLDVGCGTGRWAAQCESYWGVDVSRDAVAFARARGLTADVIDGPRALYDSSFGYFYARSDEGAFTVAGSTRRHSWISCFSVFTHIDRAERLEYLRVFAGLTSQLLVDVIPGDGSGDVSLWTADVAQFEADLMEMGWRIGATACRRSPDGVRHQYYVAVRP